MAKLSVFQNVSLDGYFVDRAGEMTWAKQDADPEFMDFAAENARGDGVLLFGRVTYQMMESFWTAPQARQAMPVVAERMNNGRKIVFSESLARADWSNTELLKADLPGEVRRLKSTLREGLVILGSGSLVAQLSAEKLIDEYQLVVNPVVLGAGRTMFEGLRKNLDLRLTKSRTFRNGKVYLAYEPQT